MARVQRAGMLVLKDGTVLEGQGFGAATRTHGEVVFNTSLTGYPEVLTDPSYAGQLVTLTQTQVGNYGVTQADLEAALPHAQGLIVRSLPHQVSNWRSEVDLDTWMAGHHLPGLCNVDTRALVTHLRTAGSQPGILASAGVGASLDVTALLREAATLPTMHGQEWVTRVTCKQAHAFTEGLSPLGGELDAFPGRPDPQSTPHVVAMDYGAKRNILRLLKESGCRVTVMPAQATAAEILAQSPDGLFLSNGPGDPATCGSMVAVLEKLLGKLPVFGICLGHQLLAQAVGARTYKLKFGHRGGNQPVQDLKTGKVHVTSQNHGFAVDATTLPRDVTVGEINLSDGTVEGLLLPSHRAFSVQYHPEAAPGPHDTRHHFTTFRNMMLGHGA